MPPWRSSRQRSVGWSFTRLMMVVHVPTRLLRQPLEALVLPYVRAGCQIVNDTLSRADQEASQRSASTDLSKLAHPYHRQDMWDATHQADLQRALDQLRVADHFDG